MSQFVTTFGPTLTIPAGTGQIITVAGRDIPTENLVGIIIATGGVGGELSSANLAQFKLKAGSREIVDLTAEELRSLMEVWGPSHPEIGAATIPSYAYLPLNLFDLPDTDAADICGFPQGMDATLEITSNDPVGLGTLRVGFVQSTRTPTLTSRLIGNTVGIGPTETDRLYNLSGNGNEVLRGIAIPQTGLNQLSMTVGRRLVYDSVPGGVGATSRNLLIAAQLLNGANRGPAAGTANLDPLWLRPGAEEPLGSKAAMLKITTGATWPATGARVAAWFVGPQ